MARIVYTLGELAGSIGGLTFQRNASGTIVRTRPAPTKKSTTKQTATHIDHTQWLYEWQQLTQAQRDDWNAYAALWPKTNKWGQSKILTGQNWFESANYHLPSIGEAILTSPPAHTLPQDPPDFAIILTDTTISISPKEAHNYNDYPVLVWVSAPTRKNTASINQTRRLALIIENLVTDPFDITTEWQNATSLPFTPDPLFPSANLFVCLQSIARVSGITSALLCNKENTEEIYGLMTDAGDWIMTDAGEKIQIDH